MAIVQPGQTPEAAEQALIAEFEKLKQRAGHRQRAAARQEPVRARLHRQPRVERGQGAAPGARGGDPQRHHDGRRRVRHLHERDAADVQRVAKTYFNADQPRRAAHPAQRGGVAMNMRRLARSGPCLAVRLGVGSWCVGSCPVRVDRQRADRRTGRLSGRRGRWRRAR